MRIITSLLFISMLLITGCESMSTGVRERFAPVPPKVRQFDGDVHTVFAAAQLACKRLDFVLTDSSGAPTYMEVSSRVMTSELMRDSRQLVATIRLHEIEGGKTEVAVLVSLQVENASLGGPSAQNQREHGFYGSFFTALQEVLQEKSSK